VLVYTGISMKLTCLHLFIQCKSIYVRWFVCIRYYGKYLYKNIWLFYTSLFHISWYNTFCIDVFSTDFCTHYMLLTREWVPWYQVPVPILAACITRCNSHLRLKVETCDSQQKQKNKMFLLMVPVFSSEADRNRYIRYQGYRVQSIRWIQNLGPVGPDKTVLRPSQ
jgi:hypothetical protein